MHTTTIISCLCHLALLTSVVGIFHGDEVPPALYRWFVDWAGCGGALISSRYMITSARDAEVITRKAARTPFSRSGHRRRNPVSTFHASIPELYTETWKNKNVSVENLWISNWAIVQLNTPISVCDNQFDPAAVLLPFEAELTAENMLKAESHYQCIQAGFGKQKKDKDAKTDHTEWRKMKQQRIMKGKVDENENGRFLNLHSDKPGTHACDGDDGTPVFCIINDYPVLMSLVNQRFRCGEIHDNFYGPDIHHLLQDIKNLLPLSMWNEIIVDQNKCRAYYMEHGFLTAYVEQIKKDRMPTDLGTFDDDFVYPEARWINMAGSSRPSQPDPNPAPETKPTPVPPEADSKNLSASNVVRVSFNISVFISTLIAYRVCVY